MKRWPKERPDKETISILRSKVILLERDKANNREKSHSIWYKWRVCVQRICDFLSFEDEENNRNTKTIPLFEFQKYIMEEIDREEMLDEI